MGSPGGLAHRLSQLRNRVQASGNVIFLSRSRLYRSLGPGIRRVSVSSELGDLGKTLVVCRSAGAYLNGRHRIHPYTSIACKSENLFHRFAEIPLRSFQHEAGVPMSSNLPRVDVSAATILMIGEDQMLLRSRQMIFEKNGFSVWPMWPEGLPYLSAPPA